MNDTTRVLNLASRAGRILLQNGAEIALVEQTMEQISSHYGQERENFFVISNGIFTTGDSYSHVEFIPMRGSQLDKVVEVNDLAVRIETSGLSMDEVEKELDRIENISAKPRWQQLLASALGSGGFCVIFGGGAVDALVSAFAGFMLWMFILLVGMRYFSKPFSNIVGGLIGTMVCILSFEAGIGDSLANMIIGAIIPLIPGVAFTNGLKDIIGEDYLAGSTRLLDALMVFFCIALGVCLSIILSGWIFGEIQMNGTSTDIFTSALPIQLLSACVGTYAFALLFGVPSRLCAACGVIGMVGWAVYLSILGIAGAQSVVMATFFSASVVSLLSSVVASWKQCPMSVPLICGVFPLIPGAGVFWSSYYAVSHELPQALSAGFRSFEITVAIVLSILLVDNIRSIVRR